LSHQASIAAAPKNPAKGREQEPEEHGFNRAKKCRREAVAALPKAWSEARRVKRLNLLPLCFLS
jgi:hypothetical protein